MESGVHHGGQFTTKNGIRYYKGGKTEYIYDQAVDNISVAMCEKFISADLGYKNFKFIGLRMDRHLMVMDVSCYGMMK